MKRIKITFRLTPQQLALGLQTIRQLEPSYKLISINDLVKTIYQDWLEKMTSNKLNEIPNNISDEVMHFVDKPANQQITLQNLINIKKESNKEI